MAKCKICGASFRPDPETVEMVEDGWLPYDTEGMTICDECADLSRYGSEFENETDCMGNCFSDADSGL